MCREGAWGLRFDVEKDGEQPETAAFLLYIIVIVHGSEAAPEGSTGDSWPTLRGDALLNRFFAFQSILPKALNALRLDDALSKGFSWAKNRFFTQRVNAPLMAIHPRWPERRLLLAGPCSALSHGRVSISGASACCAERWIPPDDASLLRIREISLHIAIRLFPACAWRSCR